MRVVRKERSAGPRSARAPGEDQAAPVFGIVIWPGAGAQGEGSDPAVPRERVRLRHAFAPRWPA